jgi:hypothetical protein
MKDLAVHMLAPKESKQTMHDLAVLAGGMLGGKLSQSIAKSEWLAMLKGDMDAPETVVKLLRTIHSFRDSPETLDLVLGYALDGLSSKGIETQKILKAAKDYAPILGLKMDDSSIPSLREAMTSIATRVIERADEGVVRYRAISTCNSCGFVQLI